MQRSELIVVRAIKPDSLKYMPHKGTNGITGKNYATLLVHEVLKGKCDEKEISILIYDGLEPTVGGRFMRDGLVPNLPVAQPTTAIAIFDEGGDSRSFEPLVADARENNIWCLHRDRDAEQFSKHPPKGELGIIDPEDLQPLDMKGYLKCYLSTDPEIAVRRQMQKQPRIAERALRYLQHQDVQRILAEPNAEIRVERLLPYFESQVQWGSQREARGAIVAAGSVSGPYLMGIYTSTRDPSRRDEIVSMWTQTRYDGCVDLLIENLKTEDEYWAQQKLSPGSWNHDKPLREEWQVHYNEVSSAVYALGQIQDPKAKDAIEQTRRRWEPIKLADPQIVDDCDNALRSLAASAATKP